MNFRQTNYLLIALSFVGLVFIYLNLLPWWCLMILLLLYLIRLVFGAIYIGQNFFVKSINSLKDVTGFIKNEKKLVLSFDDGIHPELTPKTMDILKNHQIKAVFFLIGKHLPGNEHILHRMVDEGHTIANHSDTHTFWFDMKSSADMLNDIQQMNDRVISIVGEQHKPTLFRPPYGVTNPNLASAIRNSGMISMGWSLRSMDTVAKSSIELLSVLKRKTRPGDIVLLHDRCPVTVDTLTDYIVFCKQQGYTFTTL